MDDNADEDASIEEIFALFDIDGDGKLTGSELKRFFAGFPGNGAPCAGTHDVSTIPDDDVDQFIRDLRENNIPNVEDKAITRQNWLDVVKAQPEIRSPAFIATFRHYLRGCQQKTALPAGSDNFTVPSQEMPKGMHHATQEVVPSASRPGRIIATPSGDPEASQDQKHERPTRPDHRTAERPIGDELHRHGPKYATDDEAEASRGDPEPPDEEAEADAQLEQLPFQLRWNSAAKEGDIAEIRVRAMPMPLLCLLATVASSLRVHGSMQQSFHAEAR